VVCVTDANIWIDLHNADLLDAAFELDHTWRTPNIIVRDEVLTVGRDLLVDLSLDVRTLSGDELNRILTLNGRYPQPSPKDLSVLVVADADNGIVVSEDGPLRAAAEAEEMTVHGVLWILDRLLEEPIITENRAATALNAMLQQGARLPDEPVENRLDEWRSS
jgi:hypothetical protein